MFAPHRQPCVIFILAFVCGVASGCIDADQGSVVVKPQRSKNGPDASESASSRKPTRRAPGTRDPSLEQELSRVDELIRQSGGDKADKLDEEISGAVVARGVATGISLANARNDDDLGAPSIKTAFAEEPAVGKTPVKKGAKANRLAKESSPYLLLHAHNPVDWFPWGPEAFEKARKEGKLIFLSIGYTSCHWCHVMERLVFENEAIAKAMNESFVCVKVDREERPDIDDIYMTALSVYFRLSGSDQNGGWPLSMFLTPEGKPIAGGTYFPPEDTDGRMGFPTVMKRISDLWRDDQKALEQNSEILTTNIRRVMSSKVALQDTPLTSELAGATVKYVAATHDSKFGGFDFNAARANAPKFPVPSKLALLLYAAQRDKDDELRSKVTFTLDAMAAGGIHDHLAGGFHRYSTDRAWLVPHFEKMLYDNAQLADVYVEAFRQTKDPAYKRIAEDICDFVLREMTDKRGGFFSALDADSEEVEGKSYVWSEREVDQLLGQDAESFKLAYGMKDKNTFEVGYVLHQPQPLDQVAAKLKLSPDDLDRQLNSAKQKLLKARNRRPPPMTDDKLLTGWNGLMIRALANAGARFDRADYLKAAERAAMFVVTDLRDKEGRLLRSFRGTASPIKAYLDDYTYLVDGLIALHLATRDQKWLNAASKLTDDQLKLFWDDQNGGFFFTATDHEELLARSKDRYDSVVPSGNSVAVRNLIRLASLSGDNTYRDKAEETLKAAAGSMQDAPGGFANMALGLFEYLDKPKFGASRRRVDPNVIPASGEEVIDIAAKPKREPTNPAPLADKPKEDAKSDKEKSAKDKKNEILTAEAHLNVEQLPAGSTCRIALIVDVKEGWHINQNPPADESQIPTTFTMKTKHGSKLTNVKYPKGHKFEFPGFLEPLLVYEGQIVLFGTIEVPEDAGGKIEEFELQVRYQACSSDRCEPPKNLKLSGKVEVAPAGQPVKKINDKLFSPPKPATKKN
jgi:uncharacterized protein YyaL (SSP411 family)